MARVIPVIFIHDEDSKKDTDSCKYSREDINMPSLCNTKELYAVILLHYFQYS